MRLRDENKEVCLKQCAVEMIVAEGFDGLSMQKLAKKAQVSPATIYIYWKNKEDLLNQLFQEVQSDFADMALEGFDAKMPLREGLWLQWCNRLRFIRQEPLSFHFYELFRHSSLIQRGTMKYSFFKESMQQFLINAVDRGEMAPMPTELYWAMAYAPFYALVRCELNQTCMFGDCFALSDDVLEQAFDMTIAALQTFPSIHHNAPIAREI